jgi:hypothetical protein
MSAWMCDAEHVSAIIDYAIPNKIRFTAADGSEVVVTPHHGGYTLRSLLRENMRSIISRYPDTLSDDWRYIDDVPYVPHQPYATCATYKLVYCYQYQASEHDAWEKSFAFRLTEAILREIEGKHGMTEKQMIEEHAYKAAEWGLKGPRTTPKLENVK